MAYPSHNLGNAYCHTLQTNLFIHHFNKCRVCCPCFPFVILIRVFRQVRFILSTLKSDSDFSRHPKVFRLNCIGSSVGYLILYSPLSIMVFIVFQLSRLCPLVTQVLSDILVTVRSEQYSPLP